MATFDTAKNINVMKNERIRKLGLSSSVYRQKENVSEANNQLGNMKGTQIKVALKELYLLTRLASQVKMIL